ncbi:hypothetical protein C464_12910 [Halorubrum coriense DSM 10284]|uniref:Uncharacterized protein n=1 Tax=Halorubrum coriense DSM 10284 TaxID=1227466 RepID=M0EDF2_9EURY|nr:hypothetical protein C464_12910 [Halorubrum coriense DSM 10284]
MATILFTGWRPIVVAEQPGCLVTADPWSLVVLFVVSVPRVAVFDRQLSVPLPVGRLVDFVNVDMTTLAQRDHVGDTVVGVVSVDVME